MRIVANKGSSFRDYAAKIVRRNTPAVVQPWIRFLAFFVPIVFLSAVVSQPWVEAKWMFLDPLTAAELSGDCCHTYYGFVSNLGVLVWSATAAICLFAALVFGLQAREGRVIWFAASAGILTGWLALDDMFMVHEVVLPSFGIAQNLVLALYVSLAAFYAIASWRIILKSDFIILLVSAAALGSSIAVDTLFHSLLPALVYLEDSAKFFGICCWAVFHISTIVRLTANPVITFERGLRSGTA